MKNKCQTALLGSLIGVMAVLGTFSAMAADQTVTGAGNAFAVRLSGSSPLVQSAYHLLLERLKLVQSDQIRQNLLELMDDSKACVLHRANLSAAEKGRIIAKLEMENLLNRADADSITGGATAGVFPPILKDGEACPKLPQPIYAAPGGATGGHHSEPGGLTLHEAFNGANALGLVNSYKAVYGHANQDGLPVVAKDRESAKARSHKQKHGGSPAFFIDSDIVLAAPIVHDWAKTMVFQWNSDGTEFTEFNFGGNGATDNYGAAGSSQTGAHHILGLAEVMKRSLAPDFVITIASAHAAPTGGDEYKVVNWLRAAAIVAQIDPVAAGYLQVDSAGKLRLPAVRRLADVDLNVVPISQTNILLEYLLHNLSDSDFSFTGTAATEVGLVLAKLAPEFGYDSANADYLVKFRHPVFSYLSAERVFVLFSNGGLDAVRQEIAKLKKWSVI